MPCPPPGDLSDPAIELTSLTSPALAGGFFTTSATWKEAEWWPGYLSWSVLGEESRCVSRGGTQ